MRMPLYDTQCGAKWLRVDQAFLSAIAERFVTRWFFDVELLHRIHHARASGSVIREEPLETWRDIKGGHIRPREYVRIAVDLLKLETQIRKSEETKRIALTRPDTALKNKRPA
jgi:hypothetical protein